MELTKISIFTDTVLYVPEQLCSLDVNSNRFNDSTNYLCDWDCLYKL